METVDHQMEDENRTKYSDELPAFLKDDPEEAAAF